MSRWVMRGSAAGRRVASRRRAGAAVLAALAGACVFAAAQLAPGAQAFAAAPTETPVPASSSPPISANAPAPANAPTPAAAAELEKYLAGLASWSADFEQNIEDANGQVLRSAAGRLSLRRPGRFRWDYIKPSEQLILADGKRIWFYDKDLSQANVRDMDASLASTPASLLSGEGSVTSQFDVAALPPSDGLKWYQLIPKHSDTDFKLVRVGIDKSGDLRSMFLADKLNQITQLSFSNAKRNEKFPQGEFNFVPPPGVDVIGQSAK